MKYRYLIWDAESTRFLGTNSPDTAKRYAKATGCAVVDTAKALVMGLGESRASIEEAPAMGSHRFKVGDRVSWTSQAGGYSKTKTGSVAAVVRPGEYPDRAQFLSLYRGAGVGIARDHESYVVTVKGAGVYWPRVKALNAASDQHIGGAE